MFTLQVQSNAKAIAIVALCIASAIPGLALAQDTPTAQEVFDKYIEATGGKDAYESIENRVQKGTFNLIDMGMTAQTEAYYSPPNSLTIVTIEGMGEVRNGVTDGVAWSMNPFQGDQILEGAQKTNALREADLAQYLNWEKHYESAEVTGEAEVGDAQAWTVILQPKEGNEMTAFFGKDSGYLLKLETTDDMGGQTGIVFTDYKEADGLTLPHKTEISAMMGTIEISWDSIEHNVDIPDDQFALPESIEAIKGQ